MGDQDVLMVRASDGRVRTLYNCLAMGAPRWWRMAKAVGKFFRCPYHAWTRRTAAIWARRSSRPEGTSRPHRPGATGCAGWRVESYRGFVFASQAKEGPALADFLGGVRSSIDTTCATARR